MAFTGIWAGFPAAQIVALPVPGTALGNPVHFPFACAQVREAPRRLEEQPRPFILQGVDKHESDSDPTV